MSKNSFNGCICESSSQTISAASETLPFYQGVDECRALLLLSSLTGITSDVFVKIPMTVNPSFGPYDAGNNEIKFPTKGNYMIVWKTYNNVNDSDSGSLYLQVWNATTNTEIGPTGHNPDKAMRYAKGNDVTERDTTWLFMSFVDIYDTDTRVQLRVRRTGSNVSDFLLMGFVVRMAIYV